MNSKTTDESNTNDYTTSKTSSDDCTNKYRTRNLLDLKVGKSHCIQIILNLRAKDLNWFDDNSNEYMKELIEIMSTSILPKECKGDIISAPHNLKDDKKSNVGKNNAKRGPKSSASLTRPNKRKKETRKTVSKSKAVETKEESEQDGEYQSRLSSSLFKSENTFLYSRNIQILYKSVNIKHTSKSAILNYTTHQQIEEEYHQNKSGNKKTSKSGALILSTFQCLKPIPKQIIIWLYPFDPDNPLELDMSNVGNTFPRPDLIPISSLYCEE